MNTRGSAFTFAAFALLLLLTSCSRTAEPNTDMVVLANGEALDKDAAVYAQVFNVPQSEAVRRLELQGRIGKLDAELAVQEPDTYAGLWINNDARYSVTVAVTDNPDAVKDHIRKYTFAGIVEVVQKEKSLKQLEAEQEQAVSVLINLGIESESEINVFQNRVDILVLDIDKAESVAPATDSALAGTAAATLPPGVNLVEVSAFSQDTANAFAGNRIAYGDSFCTSGYSVFDRNNLYGITTAGHCTQPLNYGSVEMPRVAEWYSGARDLQWHRSPNLLFKPWARDNEPSSGGTTFYREIYAVANRVDQPLNGFFCKYGATTQHTCGTLVSKTFNPADRVYNDLRNNSSTFMRLNRSGSNIITKPGDSGGPVYTGHKALGLTKGGWYPGLPSGCPTDYCGDMIYMAINYVTDIGLRIFIAPQ